MSAVHRYRADIDGLRAIAVLSVVLYHINHAWIPGGYVGVDIFFVISGYLITRNIASEQSTGRFGLFDFYLRRIRRIAPAFFLVVGATLLAGALLLLPGDLLRLAKASIWSSASSANIYFWKYLDTSYFAASTAEEPLLHMWSLGVEEQFYFLWPLLLIFAAKFKRRKKVLFAVAGIICGLSFAAAQYTSLILPKFSYYMLPTRAGELMVGALFGLFSLTWRDHAENQNPRGLGSAVTLVGILLIAYSLVYINDNSRFPGVNALFPCVGSALVIAGGMMGSVINRRVLGSRIIVFFGLISYSLYLWHWPILAFIRYFYGEISLLAGTFAFALAAALAFASYKLVEVPFRRIRIAPSRQVVGLWALPALLVIAASSLIIFTGGLRGLIEGGARYSKAAATLDMQTQPASRAHYPCMDPRTSTGAALAERDCVLGLTSGSNKVPNFFVWGDSNAGHYLGALDSIAKKSGLSFRYIALSTCPSIYGEASYGASYLGDRCSKFRDVVRNYLKSAPFRTVVLASQWQTHENQVATFSGDVAGTIKELVAAGKRVVVLGQAPSFPAYNKDCLLRWARISNEQSCAQRQSQPDRHDLPANDLLRSIVMSIDGSFYLNARDELCANGICSPYIDGEPVYFNTTHLSWAGSERLGKKILASGHAQEWIDALGGKGDENPLNAGVTAFSGVKIDFPSRVRSEATAPFEKGGVKRRLTLEYIGIDRTALELSLRKAVAARGYALAGPEEIKGTFRYFVVSGNRRMGAIAVTPAGPSLKLDLSADGANGVIYLEWVDGGYVR